MAILDSCTMRSRVSTSLPMPVAEDQSVKTRASDLHHYFREVHNTISKGLQSLQLLFRPIVLEANKTIPRGLGEALLLLVGIADLRAGEPR